MLKVVRGDEQIPSQEQEDERDHARLRVLETVESIELLLPGRSEPLVLRFPEAAWALTPLGPDSVLSLLKKIPGTAQSQGQPIEVCQGVPLLLGLQVDLKTGEPNGRAQMALWQRRNSKDSIRLWDVEADLLGDAKAMGRALAGQMVLSLSPADVLPWLHTLRKWNDLPVWPVTRRCGWHEGEEGYTFVAPTWQVGTQVSLSSAPTKNAPKLLQYTTSKSGDLAQWWSAMSEMDMARFPIFGVMLGAVVGSLVCEVVLSAPAFPLEIVAPSQQGKTFLARVVQSFCGRPGKEGIEMSTNSSMKGLNAAISYLHCLPVFADDETASQAGDNDVTAGWMAYNVANGAGRLTSDVHHNPCQQGSWKLVALITSETPMLRAEKRTGALVRCHSISAHPFSSWDKGLSRLVDPSFDYLSEVITPLSGVMNRVYGWGMREVARKAVSYSVEKLSEIFEEKRRETEEVLKQQGVRDFANPIARQIALIRTGIWMLREMGLDLSRVLREEEVVAVMVLNAAGRFEAGTVAAPWRQAWEAFLEWAPNQLGGRIIDTTADFYATRYTTQDTYGVWDTRGSAALTEERVDRASSDPLAHLSAAAVEENLSKVAATSQGLGDLHLSLVGLDAFLKDWHGPLDKEQIVRAWGEHGILHEYESEQERERKREAAKKAGKPVRLEATPWHHVKKMPRKAMKSDATMRVITVKGDYVMRRVAPA